MNMWSVGSAANYVKTKALQIKWQQRKENPLKAKEDEDPQVAALKKQAEDARKGQQLSALHSKLMSGMRLSKEEMEYLKVNSPEEYERAVKVERERKAYKQELERCRSKEDVEKLNQRKLQEFSAEAKAISHNPNIPEGKKKELLDFLTMRMQAGLSERAAFMQTKEYMELPDTEEEAEEKKKMKNVDLDDGKKDVTFEFSPSGTYDAGGNLNENLLVDKSGESPSLSVEA